MFTVKSMATGAFVDVDTTGKEYRMIPFPFPLLYRSKIERDTKQDRMGRQNDTSSEVIKPLCTKVDFSMPRIRLRAVAHRSTLLRFLVEVEQHCPCFRIRFGPTVAATLEPPRPLEMITESLAGNETSLPPVPNPQDYANVDMAGAEMLKDAIMKQGIETILRFISTPMQLRDSMVASLVVPYEYFIENDDQIFVGAMQVIENMYQMDNFETTNRPLDSREMLLFRVMINELLGNLAVALEEPDPADIKTHINYSLLILGTVQMDTEKFWVLPDAVSHPTVRVYKNKFYQRFPFLKRTTNPYDFTGAELNEVKAYASDESEHNFVMYPSILTFNCSYFQRRRYQLQNVVQSILSGDTNQNLKKHVATMSQLIANLYQSISEDPQHPTFIDQSSVNRCVNEMLRDGSIDANGLVETLESLMARLDQ